ncbi:uncharacterized protein LOC112460020 [Temnothorax curvispinosus]|uniref:Uncharacterized protein LOC112460020 n=1 Tax=Temnothorax curvispinosus TaxID=300111 RepID=A0A6J1QEK7_9HYME|nr:uncharacterized protein LOC112460020 [Temnothorax curvispinosus]
MQAAGTLCGTRTISLLALLVPLIGYAYSSPIQYLPSIPGYIPVYIRYGDEPLEGINPELAEAFGETSNSVKSLQKIDHTLAHESDNFKDDDINTFMEESNREHVYPLHVREAESRSFAAVNDNEPGNPNKPKLLTIYTLPDDNKNGPRRRSHYRGPRRRYRERSRIKNSGKQPTFKVNPLSDEEKEELEKLAIEVEKEETKPNELYAPNPRYPESPSENTHSRHRTHNFIAPIKVQVPLDETLTDLPKIPQISDFSQSDHDIATFEAEEAELPIKGQGPATFLSNVDKLSPIDLPNENEANKNSISETEKVKERPLMKIDLLEIPQDTDFSKSSDEHNIAAAEADKNGSPIKIQRPTTFLSNVDKLSPIALPNETKTNEKKEIKDFIQHADEVATD